MSEWSIYEGKCDQCDEMCLAIHHVYGVIKLCCNCREIEEHKKCKYCEVSE